MIWLILGVSTYALFAVYGPEPASGVARSLAAAAGIYIALNALAVAIGILCDNESLMTAIEFRRWL